MSESGGGGAGVMVGAGVGGAVVVVVVIALVIYCYMKARKEKRNTNMTKSNDIFHTGKSLDFLLPFPVERERLRDCHSLLEMGMVLFDFLLNVHGKQLRSRRDG